MVSCVMVFFCRSRLDRIFHILSALFACVHLIYLQVFENQITIQAKINGTSLSTEFVAEIFTKLPKIIITEFAFLAAHDSLLFILIIFGLLSSVVLRGRYMVFTITVFLASFLVAAVNGTVGNGFRYQLPIVITIAPMALLFIRRYVSNEFNLIGRKMTID